MKESLYIHPCVVYLEGYGGEYSVDRGEFSYIRGRLGKTQHQMAQLLGTSLKAVQSFEQGWRRIPVHIERQMLFLLAQKNTREKGDAFCWDLQRCPPETRQKCPAWEFHCGHLCWFINGTVCHGEVKGSWQEKMEQCRKCKVFRSMVSSKEQPNSRP